MEEVSSFSSFIINQALVIGSKVKRHYQVLIIVLLSILLRIPRVPGIIGNDAFVILWMARMVSEGNFINWTLSPLSLVGMYPFSFYPIGVTLILGSLMSLGASFEVIVTILSYSH